MKIMLKGTTIDSTDFPTEHDFIMKFLELERKTFEELSKE